MGRVPAGPAAIGPALQSQERVFRARVAIDEVAPRLPGAAERLRPGMTLTANLVLQRRSLWEVLFNPIAAALRA